jgi:hypothetical protein
MYFRNLQSSLIMTLTASPLPSILETWSQTSYPSISAYSSGSINPSPSMWTVSASTYPSASTYSSTSMHTSASTYPTPSIYSNTVSATQSTTQSVTNSVFPSMSASCSGSCTITSSTSYTNSQFYTSSSSNSYTPIPYSTQSPTIFVYPSYSISISPTPLIQIINSNNNKDGIEIPKSYLIGFGVTILVIIIGMIYYMNSLYIKNQNIEKLLSSRPPQDSINPYSRSTVRGFIGRI